MSYGEVRRMHPDELLASFSFKPHEMPRLVGSHLEQYSAVCQTVCVNVFEAFAAEALAAMGKPQPREQLRCSLPDWDYMADPSSFLEQRVSYTGVPYEKYVPLHDDEEMEEDQVKPMLGWNGQ